MDLTKQVTLLSDKITPLRARAGRVMVAIAGAPASGKSTMADALAQRLNEQNCKTLVVPLDGFHLDNQILEARGDLHRKGAPHTFDGAGFVHTVHRLKENVDVVVPVFERSRDLAIAGARVVPADAQVVVVEGNYLLFDDAPWVNLAPLWSLSVRLEVPMSELRARLIQRWLDHGLNPAAATRRAERNDIPNAQSVIEKSLSADVRFGADGTLL